MNTKKSTPRREDANAQSETRIEATPPEGIPKCELFPVLRYEEITKPHEEMYWYPNGRTGEVAFLTPKGHWARAAGFVGLTKLFVAVPFPPPPHGLPLEGA